MSRELKNIATLHRELAEAYERLATELEAPKPRKKHKPVVKTVVSERVMRDVRGKMRTL